MTGSPHRANGHPGAYHGCTHPECREYRLRYRKRWQYEREHGHLRTVDAEPVSRRIWTLMGAGWTARAIAGAAETSPSVVTRLSSGDQTRVTRKVAARILAVDPSGLPLTPSKQTTEPFVSRVGSVRRIQALLFMGWSHAAMYERSGVRTQMVLAQQGRWVTRSTHDKVAALYDALWSKPGTSAHARTWARKLGYAPPLAWDDIDRDAEPQGAAS